ncbi:FMN reductase [NAD(P)H] [uncultured Clostridium sp.]|nr:FMN reductase [NAD(P)H] [uncultured Clostridium sp.]
MHPIIEKILTRHAIRRFQDKQIRQDELDQILQAGLYAPSAGNNQRSKIIVCQNREINKALGQLSRYMQFKDQDPSKVAHAISAEQPSIQDDFTLMDGFYHAPTVLHLFTRRSQYAHDDCAMMAENMMLAAHFLGIGSCYIGRAQEVFATPYGQNLMEKWDIPDDLTPVAHVVLGYREGPEPHAKPRKEGRVLHVE